MTKPAHKTNNTNRTTQKSSTGKKSTIKTTFRERMLVNLVRSFDDEYEYRDMNLVERLLFITEHAMTYRGEIIENGNSLETTWAAWSAYECWPTLRQLDEEIRYPSISDGESYVSALKDIRRKVSRKDFRLTETEERLVKTLRERKGVSLPLVGIEVLYDIDAKGDRLTDRSRTWRSAPPCGSSEQFAINKGQNKGMGNTTSHGWTMWVPYRSGGRISTYGYNLNAEGSKLVQGIFDKLGYGRGDRLYLRMGGTRCALSASNDKACADRTKWSGPWISDDDDIMGFWMDDSGDFETDTYVRPIAADPKNAERWTVSLINNGTRGWPDEEEVPTALWPELDRNAERRCGKWKQIETEVDFDGENYTVVFNKECLFDAHGIGLSEKARKAADYVYANLSTVLAKRNLTAGQ